jgi:amino acid adenylation domain-containing protein
MDSKQSRLFEKLLKEKGIQVPRAVLLRRGNEKGPFKLSFSQQRIWFLQRFDPASAAYNEPAALRIRGPLQIPVLERTLNEIIRRHQVLRMTFPVRQAEPIQKPHQNETVTLAIISLPGWSGYEPGKPATSQINEFVNCQAGQTFDITGEMLFRAALLKIGEDDHVLVVTSHHILMDGWSKGLMLKELIILYEAFIQDKPSPFSDPPIQYTDYVEWHHDWIQGNVFDSQLCYWKEKLKGAPALLELPSDHMRPNVPTGKGSLEPFSFSPAQFQALNDLAREENITLFMLLLAAYNILLYRCSSREDILVGSPVAGRGRVELESLIGMFVNTLVLRTDLSGEPDVKELLRRVRTTALDAYAHQDMPFEKLVEALNPRRNLSVTPLFQVMFQLQNAPMPPARIHGLTITPIQVDTGFSQVDLSLTVWEEQGILKGTYEYNTDLWEASSIKRMIGHFQVLLDGILYDEEQKISRLSMLTEVEKQQLLQEWNNTDCDYPRGSCICELFTSCVRENPDQDAVIFNDRGMTYAWLDQKANRLGRVLQRLGVGPEIPGAICMENSLELIVGIIGILKAGGAYIPMDPTYPHQRLKSILKDAQPRVLITNNSQLNRFEGYKGKIICLEDENDIFAGENAGSLDGPGSITDCPGGCQPHHAACVIYTSGSTGEPKGILIDNRNIVNLVYSFIESYNPGPGDRILPLTSIASASFVGEILPMLISGGGIVLADKVHFLDMKKLDRVLADFEITILSTVPSMIARLNRVELQPGKLRLLLSGGETLSAGDIDHLAASVKIVNGYGLTEATICSTYNIVNKQRLDFARRPVISVGRPIINTRLYILDRYENLVPISVHGEIHIAGHGLARGYLNNPELTAQKFINYKLQHTNYDIQDYKENKKLLQGVQGGGFLEKNPPGRRRQKIYKTGDLGRWHPDGNVEFLGRMDTQVQVHGYRIELSEIEMHLGLHPEIRDAVVIHREVTPGDRRLVAYFITGNSVQVTGSQLRDWLKTRVPDYMIPTLFEKVDTIPLNVNGKIDINALPVPKGNRPGLDVVFKEPQTEIERGIACIWQELLHVDKVGVHDNFFELGGHSLLLMQVHSRIIETYREELSIVDMFRYPTIHLLAKFLGEGETQPLSYAKIEQRAGKQRQAYRHHFHPRGTQRKK